jgi:hypothetical protein
MPGCSTTPKRTSGANARLLHSINKKEMCGYVQDERYIAIEHMDVRRDCSVVAQHLLERTLPALSSRKASHNSGYGR